MLRLVDDLEDPASREQPRALHASAVVVDGAGERTCLVDHVKLGHWLQPGGHIEPGDASPAQAAVREAREETGLEVRLTRTRRGRSTSTSTRSRSDRASRRTFTSTCATCSSRRRRAREVPRHGSSLEDAYAAADEPALRRLLVKADRILQRLTPVSQGHVARRVGTCPFL